MAAKKAIDKLYEAISTSNIGKLTRDKFSDNSASWVDVECKDYSICFVFDGLGKKLNSIKVCRNIWQMVDSQVVINLEEKIITNDNN